MSSDLQAGGRAGAGEADRWALTAEAFASLLDFLGPDRETAGEEYDRLRRRLSRIFVYRQCRQVDELVDETFDRVAHKLCEGLEVRAEDPLHYLCGVAFRVQKEILREEARARRALAELPRQPPPEEPDPEDEIRLACLEACLAELEDGGRELLLAYHEGDGRARIRNRKALARRLDVPINALRIRAHRLRVRVERCVRSCVKTK